MPANNGARQGHGEGDHLWKSPDTQPLRRNRRNSKDVQAAAIAHEEERIELVAEQDGETGKSQYLGNMVYGGLDGIVTTFAIVSGVVGADLSPGIILILGLANLLGDGFSMATGAFLSSKSEQEVFSRERKQAAERLAQAPEKERESLCSIYRKQGFPEDDARRLTEIKSRDPGRWVSTILAEKHLLVPEKRKPILEALATFVAFVTAGTVPLLIYLADLILGLNLPTGQAFIVAIVLSGVALLGLGAAKVLVTGLSPLRSAVEMLTVGGLAAVVAFSVGTFLKGLGGPSH